MAHAVVEWTANLQESGFVPRPFLELIACDMREADGVFPIGGIRVRAIRLDDYVIADDSGPEDAFINIAILMGAGRSDEFKSSYFSALFDKLKAHLQPIFETRPLALSMYINEATPQSSFKANTIHIRLKGTD
ncbi:hypothetical protein [uncultured Hyphomonas sp.]|uniref:hypothetical protein n=1 Tax=uncultured Hyphomonas sp. TaxID=225298 RepID=UPI002AAA8D56|nr:hypothetical protein [uncultured Hyphomonas sp.]